MMVLMMDLSLVIERWRIENSYPKIIIHNSLSKIIRGKMWMQNNFKGKVHSLNHWCSHRLPHPQSQCTPACSRSFLVDSSCKHTSWWSTHFHSTVPWRRWPRSPPLWSRPKQPGYRVITLLSCTGKESAGRKSAALVAVTTWRRNEKTLLYTWV